MTDLSIITVLFNPIKNGRQEMLLQAIHSVDMQQDANYEHIIIDGGSNDGTVELLQKLQSENKFTSYISEPDKGIYDAMNKGVALAKGTYIGFLNSDDYYTDKYAFKKIINHIQHYDFLYSPVHLIDENDQPCGLFKPTPYRFLTKMPFAHQSLIAKKTIFNQLKGFDISFKLAADYDFILRMMLNKYRGYYLKNILSVFRMGGFSDKNKTLDREEKANIWQKNLGNIQSNKISNKKTLSFKILLENLMKYPHIWRAVLNELTRTMRKLFNK